MKTCFLIILLICSLLQSQISLSQSSEHQLNYLKSNPKELLDENEKNLFNNNDFDTLILNGGSNSDYFGYSVSSAGDVNGDGYSDIIVGYNINNIYPNGRWCTSIFYGGSEMDNIADVTLTGQLNTGIFSVSTAGDVNGDGYSDVIVGTSGFMVYVFYGGISMDTSYDFSFYVNNNAMDYQYYSVSTAGDVNGDGYSDVIIGLSSWQSHMINGPGALYIFYGGIVFDNIADVTSEIYMREVPVSTAGDVNGDGFSDVIIGPYIYYGGTQMNNIADVILTGESQGFGWSVSTAGDVNDDGYSDVIVGASLRYGTFYIGKGYIFFGGVNMNNVADLILVGGSEDYRFANSVSTAGDENGDGFSDVVIGAYGFNSGTGHVYLYFGGSSMDNIADVSITGANTSCQYGFSVSTAGDVNGDGNSEIIVGAPLTLNNGKAYLYQGLLPNINLNIKVSLEGTYFPSLNLLSRKDSVTAYLHQSTPPFNIIDSAKASVDSISFTGLFKFFRSPIGTYYISVKHLNSIETWSKSGGELLVPNNSIQNYDFTISNTQAFGNNLKLKGSKYCLYSGDINQDGFITSLDALKIYNDLVNFISGNYLSTDLNGDGIVDLADKTICYNNSINFVSVIRP